MKKTLRSILAGALSLLAVSCYDDTAINQAVTELGDRVSAIEATLSAEVNGINDLVSRIEALEGKVAAIKLETKDGVTTLTLSNDSKVVLSQNGALTIVDGGWATIAADGTVTPLGVKVGHELSFRVTDNVLEVSYDGTTYESTGVQVSDYTAHVIGNVVESEDGSSVTITIGDAEYVLPLLNLDFALAVKSGKTYFEAGQTKSVEVALEGVSTLVVMNQPYGWKASINGSKLVVTAPAAANADAELSGKVILHGDANGSCITAVLNVAVGKGFELTVSSEGVISIVNPLVVTTTSMWGDVMTDFSDAVVGITTPEIWNSYASVADFYKEAEFGIEGVYVSYLSNLKANLELGNWYEAGVYEVDEYSVPITTFGGGFWPAFVPVKGEKYVIFAIPQDGEGVHYDDCALAYYEPVLVEPAAVVSFNEVLLTVNLYGTEVAYAGVVEASMFEGEEAAMTFDQYMEVGYGYGGPWKQFQQNGMFEAIGQEVLNGAELSLTALNYGDALLPATKYLVWLMPKKGSKAPAEYDYTADFKPYVFEYTTSDIVAGGVEATLELKEATYTSLSVNITGVAEGTSAWYQYYEVGAIDEMSDIELAKDVMGYGYPVDGPAELTYGLSDGQTKVLVVLTVDAEGKYAIATQSFTTLSYPIVDTITATVESVTKGEGKEYTAVIAVTGATKVALYPNYSASYSSFNKYLASKSTYMKYADVVDGKATVTFTASADYYYMCVAGFNENADGTVKEFSKYTSTQISSLLLPETK